MIKWPDPHNASLYILKASNLYIEQAADLFLSKRQFRLALLNCIENKIHVYIYL